MQPAQLERDLVDVGDDLIAGQAEVAGHVSGQRAVAAPGQQLRAAADPPVSVQRDRDVDVVKELRESGRLVRPEASRRQVVWIAVGMPHQIHRRVGRVGGAFGDHVGHLLQAAAVNGKKAEARPQPADLDHPGLR